MVPNTLIPQILDYYHGPSHRPLKDMRQRIQEALFIPKLNGTLSKYTDSCKVCLSVYSRPKLSRANTKTTTPIHPWTWAAIDLVGPLTQTLDKNLYILTFVDLFSKWVELRPLPDKTAESVIRALDSILSVRGPPLNILHDNGREFVNHNVQSYLTDLSIKTIYITPYAPWSNGCVERHNRKLSQQLKLNNIEELVWDRALPSIQLSMNLSRLEDGTSPYLRLHGWILLR